MADGDELGMAAAGDDVGVVVGPVVVSVGGSVEEFDVDANRGGGRGCVDGVV